MEELRAPGARSRRLTALRLSLASPELLNSIARRSRTDGVFARGQLMQAFHGRPIVIGIPSAIGVAGSMACGLAPKRFGARVGYSRFAGDPGKDFRTLHHDVFPF
jgi:hypothetical protein